MDPLRSARGEHRNDKSRQGPGGYAPIVVVQECPVFNTIVRMGSENAVMAVALGLEMPLVENNLSSANLGFSITPKPLAQMASSEDTGHLTLRAPRVL